MKRLSRILPFLLAALVAVPLYAQQQDGSLAGRVIGREGTTPAQGVVIWIDSLVTNNGRIQTRERLTTKTGRDGRYTVQIRDALHRGREDFVYRLTLGEIPFVTSVFPLGVS